MSFCTKCGKEIPEKAAFCPSCGARSSNTAAAEAAPSIEQDAVEKKDGTLIFWMALLFGSLGVLCFMLGRPVRGFLYFIFGGMIPAAIAGLMAGMGQPIDTHSWTAAALKISGLVVLLFTCIDMLNIARNKYRTSDGKSLYSGARYMIVLTVVAFFVSFFFRF